MAYLRVRGPGALLGGVLAALILLAALAALVPLGAASGRGEIANVQQIWNIPAPVTGVAASLDGHHVAVLDDEARLTVFLDKGERSREWRAPSSGVLGLLEESLAEVPPVPAGVGMTPDGEHWAAAVAYDDSFAGRLYGFAHWSDEPIWRYQVPQPQWGQPVTRITAVDSGGPYHVMGTSQGKVLLFRAGDEGSTSKSPFRTYQQDNFGTPFGAVSDVGLSRDGKLILIGTRSSGTPSVHLFTETFFKATFTRITQPVEQVAIAPEALRGVVVTGSGEATRIHVLDLDRGRTLWERTIGSSVSHTAFSADGSLLAVGTAQGRVLLFEERDGLADSEPRQSFMFQGQVSGIAVADDARAVSVVTTHGDLHFLDAHRPAALWSYPFGEPMEGVTLSADAGVLAVGARLAEEGRLVYAEAKHELLHAVTDQPRLLPGPGQAIPVELANNGNRMARVAVEWRSLPEGWKGLDSNTSLAPGEQGTLLARLDLPAGQRADAYDVAFDLVTEAGRVPVEVTPRVPEVTIGRTVTVWSFEHAVPGGGPAAFLFRLENIGNTMNEIAVGYSGLPVGWEAEFSGATELRLRPGEDRQIALTVRAPADAPAWREAGFDLVVAWQQGEERVPLRVALVDQAEYESLILGLIGDGKGPSEDGVAPLVKLLQDEAARGTTDSGVSTPAGGASVVPWVVGGTVAALLAGLVALVAILGWRRARSREDRLLYAATRQRATTRTR